MAAAADVSLGEGVPVLTRRMLPPRLPPSAGSYATPGAPSAMKPGVYLADRAKQLAEAQAEAEAAAILAQQQYNGSDQQYNGVTGSTSSLPRKPGGGASGGGHSSSPLRGTGRSTASHLQPIVDYSYPELGHSVVAQQQAALRASTTKSSRLDVYGQPRGEMPSRGAGFRGQAEECEAALNERYLEVEGGPLRSTKNSSASLIRLAGKAGRQFTLSPAHVHFGNAVPAGTVVHRLARLQNVSTGIARYSVVRPEASALRVISRPGPGPVVPGGEALLTIEFAAPAEPCDFVGEVVIKTEVNVFTLTVSARVVAAAGGGGPGGGGSRTGGGSAKLGSSRRPKELSPSSGIELDETRSLEEMLGNEQEQPPLA